MDYTRNSTRKSPNLLTAAELEEMESGNPDGMSSAEIIDVFAGRGIRFSEATFRKYVQLGLLPRSRRIGSKGKHKGSKGIYPIGTVRQINEIKRLMSFDYTIEEIRQQFAFVGGEIEDIQRLIQQVVEKLEKSASDSIDEMAALNARRQIEEAKRSAEELVERLETAAGLIREKALLERNAV